MTQRIQQNTNLSFDLHLSDHTYYPQKNDHFDRLKHEIKILQKQNQQLQSQLTFIKKHPHQIIKQFQSKLMKRIMELREENSGIQQLMEKSKMPGYVQMTKKKQSYGNETPNKGYYVEDDLWGNRSRRNQYESNQMSEKGQVSTCQNFPIQQMNPLRQLQPMQDHQLRARTQLTSQLLQVIDRTSQMTSQLQQLQQTHASSQSQTTNQLNLLTQNTQKFQKIAKYKQKLLSLLKKLKQREQTQEHIINQYQKMYEQTYKKLRQSTQLLQQLNSINNTQNIDDIYAQVLQLQQKLKYINQQLQRIDQTQWLKDIHIQLIQALKRLGISPPQSKPTPNLSTNQLLKQKIDQLAQILIQCLGNHKLDQKQKIAMLKLYYEQQKQNNKKIIKNMQNKQQALSKKLIDLQMNN